MKLDVAILSELAIRLELDGWLRIIPGLHHATPLGTGDGPSRFSSTDASFTLLYAALNLSTAIAERIVRDRFQGRHERVIATDELNAFAAVTISTVTPLRLLDLRSSGATRLGIPTDAVRGRAQLAGRKFSQQLYDTTDFDGIAYMSRLTNAECIAVYDRAIVAKIDPACRVEDLRRLADLVPALTALNVTLRP